MGLKIIIVGAGIAGLSAAVALRQAGHEVEIFEKSAFAAETGAALVVSPNGARVLSSLGFSFTNARAVRLECWNIFHGIVLKQLQSVDVREAKKMFGAEPWAIHRVDLHNELLRLATSPDETGTVIKLHLSSEVVRGSTYGSIDLKDGSVRHADLVVAADGLKSVLRKLVTQDAKPPAHTGLSAFRLLVDTNKLDSNTGTASLVETFRKNANLLADPTEMEKERHMMWYGCRDGEVQNVVGIHPTRNVDGDDAEAVRAVMLDEYKHFHPDILVAVKQASAVKCWPLYAHEPTKDWYKGKVLLIGDAAHPMLPFSGQGANSALEDAGTLGYLFKHINTASEVERGLQLFYRARYARVGRVQTLSSVRAGREMEIQGKLQKYSDPPGSKVPSNMMERTFHDFSFDVFKKCDQVLAPERSDAARKPVYFLAAALVVYLWVFSNGEGGS